MPADPFRALRRPADPVAPREAFARDLRARIETALATEAPSEGANMSDTAIQQHQVIVPYLCVDDANAAIAFYEQAFGAFETMRVLGDDGRVGHAEIAVGGARIYLSDEYPEIGVVSPRTLGGSGFAIHLEVADCDYAYERAVEAGATSLREPGDQAHGNRNATILDPFGHRWMLSQPIEDVDLETYAARERDWDVTGETAPVELGYLVLHTSDVDRAMRFFGELFAWQLDRSPEGAHISNTRFPMGVSGHHDADDVSPYFRVADLHRFAAKVEELGGRVIARNEYASGGSVECEDDQGLRFFLWRPAPGY
jgi:uncharacterized glyoxalase superfamily protein PhnB